MHGRVSHSRQLRTSRHDHHEDSHDISGHGAQYLDQNAPSKLRSPLSTQRATNMQIFEVKNRQSSGAASRSRINRINRKECSSVRRACPIWRREDIKWSCKYHVGQDVYRNEGVHNETDCKEQWGAHGYRVQKRGDHRPMCFSLNSKEALKLIKTRGMWSGHEWGGAICKGKKQVPSLIISTSTHVLLLCTFASVVYTRPHCNTGNEAYFRLIQKSRA